MLVWFQLIYKLNLFWINNIGMDKFHSKIPTKITNQFLQDTVNFSEITTDRFRIIKQISC